MPPVFLTLDELLTIHRDQIERYGGSEGIRDMDLLKSAIAMPAAGFGGCYVHADLCEMAAAYLFHIVRNHPFVDGNKRIGAALFLWFLEKNGALYREDGEHRLSEEALVALTLLMAESNPKDKDTIVRLTTCLLQGTKKTERTQT